MKWPWSPRGRSDAVSRPELSSVDVFAAVFVGPNAGMQSGFDTWRVVTGAVLNQPVEEYPGFLVLWRDMERIPEKEDDSVLDTVHEAMRQQGISRQISLNDLRCLTYQDKHTGKTWGVVAVLRSTMGTAKRERGVVLRCSVCGFAKESGHVMELNRPPGCHLVFCRNCDSSSTDILSMVANGGVAVCPCGYMFLPGASQWFVNNPSTSSCPNCSERIQGNGTFVKDLFGFDRIL